MKILIRLPNWLGDLAMSSAFIEAVGKKYPNSTIDVIVKKELSPLVNYFPYINKVYELEKKSYLSFISFLKNIALARNNKYDLFFCLPNSFSSALLGFFSKSKKRIGYRKELRSFLLTDSYKLPLGKHRIEEYLLLLEKFAESKIENAYVELKYVRKIKRILPEGKNLIFNINSSAQSRRIPINKAVDIVKLFKQKYDYNIILIGSANEVGYTNLLEEKLQDEKNIYNFSGKLDLNQLVQTINESDLVLSTDSGIAHVANGLRKRLIVLFGAGNEINTAPFNKVNLKIIRAENIECAPCVSNKCKFETTICLTEIPIEKIIVATDQLL